MQPGLEGRRIALVATGAAAAEIHKELTAAGAVVNALPGSTDEEWQGGRYAALVIAGPGPGNEAQLRLAQLVREMMVSEKPVAAFEVEAESLQLDETLLAVKGSGDARAFAEDVVRAFSEALEEHALDEMSDQSFPASDPPAVNPGTAGHISPERGAR